MVMKLTYLQGPFTSAELALRLGGVDFIADPVASADGHALPCATIDGAAYSGASAVLRYCGGLAGLLPADALSMLQCDEMLGALAALKMAGKKEAVAAMGRVDALLARGKGPFTLGEALSVADLEMLAVADGAAAPPGENVARCVEAVRKHPGVQAAVKGGE